jgi:hypothetical protein
MSPRAEQAGLRRPVPIGTFPLSWIRDILIKFRQKVLKQLRLHQGVATLFLRRGLERKWKVRARVAMSMANGEGSANQTGWSGQAGRPRDHHTAPGADGFSFSKGSFFAEDTGKELSIFRIALGTESIPLLPFKNWGQLDQHKWVARGRLPATPAGLEVTLDHVKIAGETVLISDPDGCRKLEQVFGEWLAMEQQTVELTRKKAAAKPEVAPKGEESTGPQPLRYRVEVDNRRQVHIRCVQGKETLATIGLNLAGFKSLYSQGLMHKPHSLQVGALHDWVELDGVLFSFENARNEAAQLEQALNDRYLPAVGAGQGNDVTIFANAASSTGFDIKFPAIVGGVRDQHRRPLNEEALELLQDPDRCGLLHKSVVIKLTRPTLVFKLKTPDGGEKYFDSSPAHLVVTIDEDGKERIIDLSHPVNYMRLSTGELTAVFNHPAIHKHGKSALRTDVPAPAKQPAATPAPEVTAPPAARPSLAEAGSFSTNSRLATVEPAVISNEQPVEPQPLEAPPNPSPNQWLAEALAKPVTRHDWFVSLVYAGVAAAVGNSVEGTLGSSHCWSAALGEADDVAAADFRGFFLTQKGGFGFLSEGHLVRFNNGVVFVGAQEAAIEGIGVSLVAVGLDSRHHAYFIVTEEYRSKFGLPEEAVERELVSLQQHGATILSVSELLEHQEPLELVWTVPAEPGALGEPEVVELSRADFVSEESASI